MPLRLEVTRMAGAERDYMSPLLLAIIRRIKLVKSDMFTRSNSVPYIQEEKWPISESGNKSPLFIILNPG